MKVLVVTNAVPFVWGGAEELAVNLVKALAARPGVEAELLRLPFAWQPSEQLVHEIVLSRQLELINTDRVIGLKFPAYLVRHHHKTLWVLHQFRQAYELLGGEHSFLDAARDREIVRAVHRADDRCFAESRGIFVNSPVTRDRMERFNAVTPEVLYPPLNDAALFTGGDDGGFIFAGGRITRGKRQHLLVEAMRYTSRNCRLVVAGPPDEDAYLDELAALVESHGLGDRVTLRPGLLERTEIASLVNSARASAYVPYDEDSLGYVTMEAFAAGKPVLCTTDSGGLLEIVRPDETGLVVPPHPEALGAALERLTNEPGLAKRLGSNAATLWGGKNLTWEATTERLLA